MFLLVWIYAFYAEQTSAQVNVALNKPAFESSSFTASYAEMANDGNRVAQRYVGTCAHTTAELNPWWTVDLKGNYSIHSLRIYNRDEPKCPPLKNCGNRLAGFRVHVSDEINPTVPSTRFKHLCHIGEEKPPVPAIIDFSCTSLLVGRYVTVSLNRTSVRALTLCEVEVYGFNISVDSLLLSTSPTEVTATNTDQYMTQVATASSHNRSADTEMEGKTTSQPHNDNVSTGIYVEQSATTSSFVMDTDKSVYTPLPKTSLRDTSPNTPSEIETPSPLHIDTVTVNNGDQGFPPSHDVNNDIRFLTGSDWMGISTHHTAEMTTQGDESPRVPEMTTQGDESPRVPEMTTQGDDSPRVPEMTTQGDESPREPEMTATPALFYHITGQTKEFHSSSVTDQNLCCCSFGGNPSITRHDSNTFMSSVLKGLDIDKKNVTKERRKRISAPDDRKSSAAISVSFIAVTLALCGILLCDVNKILQDVKEDCLG